MSGAVFVDTSVLLLAHGASSAEGRACLRAVSRWREEDTALHVAAETIQEFAFHRLRRAGVERAVVETRLLMEAAVVHALDAAVLDRGLALMHAGLRGRDAMIAATALVAGFTEIVSVDGDFDVMPGLARVGP